MAANVIKFAEHIEDKVFMVTGGAAGVGAGIVRALLADNAGHVAFLDVSDREGSALEAELTDKFGALKAKFIKCDIADEAQLTAAYNQVLDKYRRLDGVINNAAVLSPDVHMYRKTIDINFTATVSSTFKALEAMGTDKGGEGGVIVNLSSLLAFSLGPHVPVYAATKTAILQFSMAMGAEDLFEKTNVRVLTVCLGPTDTAILNRTNLENYDKDPTERLISRVPVRQRVESAVLGIIEAIQKGKSGSTWIVKNDKPGFDYTDNIVASFDFLSEIESPASHRVLSIHKEV